MQNVDRPSHVQPFPEPARARCPRIEAKAVRLVTRPERLHGISRHRSGRRRLGEWAAIRPPEPERSVGPAGDLVAFLVHGPVMPTAE